MDKYAFFLPTRKGSERVKNKNTRTFAGIEGGIVRIKLEQLLAVDRVQKIFVSTNDEETIRVARSLNNQRIKIIPRPEALCLSSTNLEDLINYIPTIVEAEHIIWVHATSPLADESILNHAIDIYEEKVIEGKEFDSMMSVTKVQQFLWSDKLNAPLNYDRSLKKWPRTQDIEPVYDINSAFFINSRENYLRYHDRIGEKPYLAEIDKIHAMDIDWEEDFKMTEYMYTMQKDALRAGGGKYPTANYAAKAEC